MVTKTLATGASRAARKASAPAADPPATAAVKASAKVARKSPARPAAKAAAKPAAKRAPKLARAPRTGPSLEPGAGSDAGYEVLVRHRTDDGQLQTLTLKLDDRRFYPEVQRWRYVVANRRRITRATRETLGDDLADWMLAQCGMQDDRAAFDLHVKAMARAPLVEVVIPYVREEQGWAARLFPWENTLALLTRPLREEGSPFTVVRYLKPAVKSPLPDLTPTSLLLVRSGPGALGSHYDLVRECAMVEDALRDKLSAGTRVLLEPDRAALRGAAHQGAPSVIHLAGVDPSALETLGLQVVYADNRDGFVLRMAERGFDALRPSELAPLLTAGTPKPLLVAVSSCFSASRVCALAVAGGARYAIGFFDSLTDADAMLFFGSFYREWPQDWDVLRAFNAARAAWEGGQGMPLSTGVVLWSRDSLLAPEGSRKLGGTDTSVPTPATVNDLRLSVGLTLDRGQSGLAVQRTSLNYSLLHNDRSPFRTFFIDKPLPGPLPPLEVDVSLEVGGETCRCRFSEELPEGAAALELAPRIRLPLISGLLRQCTESLRTNLYVKVRCGDRLLRESSERVTVLPADEWRDDGEDHRWLPSFVLPRDPAVLKVVSSAQRYLRTLLDDCTAGFDGYQQLNGDDSNSAAVVDPQVRALWAALQQELPVNYINPPPSYTSQSQRLRSPSEVFRGGAATCIDLALLFASCLEFVGIYPVLFLIEGHAFPGYWRSDKAWWRMKHFRFNANDAAPMAAQVFPGTGDGAEAAKGSGMGSGMGDGMAPMAGLNAAVSSGQSEGWMFDGVGNLVELLRYVQDGSLVPFESTFVATQRGFYAALEEGSARLHPDSFDSMVEIQSARAANVTPLPLFDKFS